MGDGVADLMAALGRLLADGVGAVLVTVVAVEGDPPSYPGAKLLVSSGRIVAGTLGCSEFDAAGAALAAEFGGPHVGGPEVSGGGPGAATLRRRAVFGHGAAQVLDLFAERFEPSPGAIVVGDNPVGRSVADVAGLLGWRVRLLGGADEAAAPGEVTPADPVGYLTRQPPGPRDAVVVSDHDAPWAADVLNLALTSAAFFVGMLGSRRHAPRVLDQLRAAGLAPERLADVHTPCGLDIGARTPAEIALSIVAEMVAVERGRPGGSLSRSPGSAGTAS